MVHPMIQSASLSNTINDTLMYHVRFRHDMIELSEKDDICSTVSEVVYRARHFDTGTETRVKASMVEVEFKLLDAVELLSLRSLAAAVTRTRASGRPVRTRVNHSRVQSAAQPGRVTGVESTLRDIDVFDDLLNLPVVKQ